MTQLTLSDYRNELFSNHFLEERIQEMDEWKETDIENRYMAFIKLYEANKRLLDNNPKESRTWSNFTRKVFKKILGHYDPQDEPSEYISEKEYNPDYTLFRDKEEFLDAQEEDNEFEICYAIVEHKRWGENFEKSTQDHRNPEYQIYDYVNTLRVPWGILTDGRKWRLYSYDKCDKKIFFEIDLLDSVVLESDEEKAKRNFKLFYLLFRKQGFMPKGSGFTDQVLQGTKKYNKQLKENLKKDVYAAVEEACKGFFEFTDQEATKENRKLVHDSALTLMYRLLFIMNAESRIITSENKGLLPVQNQTYYEEYSIRWLQEKIVEKEDIAQFKYNSLGWDRLEKLFRAINSGDQLDKNTEIPPYNGGLFEHPEEDEKTDPENRFLAENSLPGPFLKEIIKRLGTREIEGELKTVDYRDLDIRHLGSIYEGLLENELQPPAEAKMILDDEEWKEAGPKEFQKTDEENRVEEGEVYLANNSGERKETGSYYTPDYIVEYIVENTLGPKIKGKVENFSENQSEERKLAEILDLNICDPAMGSGHFLTKSTNYIADAIIHNLEMEKLEIEDEDETNWAKRQVVQNCIYGVDINPLATELAKVSLWIETMAKGKPLNFLDHHLKIGNSLIGSDFDQIFAHPTEDQKRLDNERFWFGSPEEVKQNFKEKYQKIEKMPENSVEEIHEKEEKYKEFVSSNVLYKQFKEISNIHTRQFFSNEANSSDYESLLTQLGQENHPFIEKDWFKNAQKDAKNRDYFHWKLEFPKVFFGENEGFDAIVGNPPYVSIENLPNETKEYVKETFQSTKKGRTDLYIPFIELADNLTAPNSSHGMIVPDKWLISNYGFDLRKYLLENRQFKEIWDLREYNVFEDASNSPIVYLLEKTTKSKEMKIKRNPPDEEDSGDYFDQEKFLDIPDCKIKLNLNNERFEIVQDIQSDSVEFREFCYSSFGCQPGSLSDFVFETESKAKSQAEKYDLDQESVKKFIRGRNVRRYSIDYSGEYLVYDPSRLHRPAFPELFEQDKIIFSEINSNIRATYDQEKYYGNEKAVFLVLMKDIQDLDESVKRHRDILSESEINPQFRDISLKGLTGFVNSSLSQFYFKHAIGDLLNVYPEDIRKLKIKNHKKSKETIEKLKTKVEKLESKQLDKQRINLTLHDYLGNYSDGKSVEDLCDPVKGVSNSILDETTRDKEKMKIEDVKFVWKHGELVLMVSVKYKPENPEDFSGLDTHGYTKTDYIPCIRFSGSEEQLRLIESFIPWAVNSEEAGFKKKAMKSISPRNRLEDITLPKLKDVEKSLQKFIDKKETYEHLENEIEKIDEQVDAMVFQLYSLSDNEINIILNSLDATEDKKQRIIEKHKEIKQH